MKERNMKQNVNVVMLIGKDYLHDDDMSCKFLALRCTNVLLHLL